jgi:hypothetical protein
MRRMGLVIGVLCATISGHAQTWAEWFDQKKSQIEHLVDQIGALEVYAGSLEKGYDIAHSGLTAIHNIKKGDFSLHSDYFSSLTQVSSPIKTYWKIADILETEIRIVRACASEGQLLKTGRLFSDEEIHYCSSVFSSVLEGCGDLTSQLIDLITDGKLQMKDDERLGRIDEVHAAMNDREKFILSFSQGIKTLALQRAKEENDLKVLHLLYGVQ